MQRCIVSGILKYHRERESCCFFSGYAGRGGLATHFRSSNITQGQAFFNKEGPKTELREAMECLAIQKNIAEITCHKIFYRSLGVTGDAVNRNVPLFSSLLWVRVLCLSSVLSQESTMVTEHSSTYRNFINCAQRPSTLNAQ